MEIKVFEIIADQKRKNKRKQKKNEKLNKMRSVEELKMNKKGTQTTK